MIRRTSKLVPCSSGTRISLLAPRGLVIPMPLDAIRYSTTASLARGRHRSQDTCQQHQSTSLELIIKAHYAHEITTAYA